MGMVCTCGEVKYGSEIGCVLHDPAMDHIRYRHQHDVALLHRIRGNMKRWAGRYTDSDDSQKHVKETRLLIQEIDELILRQ
jgi:hypothetical protein